MLSFIAQLLSVGIKRTNNDKQQQIKANEMKSVVGNDCLQTKNELLFFTNFLRNTTKFYRVN